MSTYARNAAPLNGQVQWLASLRHDFASPVLALNLCLSGLRGPHTRFEAVSMLDVAESALKDIEASVNDLFDALLLESEQTRVDVKTLNIGAVLRNVCSVYQKVAEANNIRFEFPRENYLVISDERHLHRILSNLVINAIKHSRATVVRFVFKARQSSFSVFCIDNGVGIHQSQLAKLFKLGREYLPRNMHLPASSRQGRGLGLYIVKAFARKLDASVGLRSSVGRGTLVRLKLRLSADAHPPVNPVLPDDSTLPLVGFTVAILDDQRLVLDSCAAMFRAMGANIIQASNHIDFLLKATTYGTIPDLFLVDYMVGSSTVASMLGILKQRYSPARIVVMTGHLDNTDVQKLAREVPVIAKPLSPSHVTIMVNSMLTARPLGAMSFS